MNDNRPLSEEYIARINHVLDYIDTHMDEDLSLELLASIAHFSPYHFHRIFSAMMGETLNRFIQRVRLEKAARQLLSNPLKSITEIALDCGFSGSSVFERSFKDAFKMSAGAWRSKYNGNDSKICKTLRNHGQSLSNHRKDITVSSSYIGNGSVTLTWRIIMNQQNVTVQVEELQEMTVAYVRHVGPYKGNPDLFRNMFEALCTWAGPRGLLSNPDTRFFAVYHDDPDITDESKQRLSVCMTAPSDTEVSGEIGKMTVSGGTYAIAHFEINMDEYEQAWNMVYGTWLPNSGYQPDDRPPFEWYLNNPEEHPEHKHIVNICVPVKPL